MIINNASLWSWVKNLVLGCYGMPSISPLLLLFVFWHILFIYLFTYTLLLKWIYYIYSCIMIITIQFNRISIPNPQCTPPPPNLSPLKTISFSVSASQYLFCKEAHCVFFQIPHVSESIWCWCLIVWLTSLSMIISRSIHVAKNVNILFLLMAE